MPYPMPGKVGLGYLQSHQVSEMQVLNRKGVSSIRESGKGTMTKSFSSLERNSDIPALEEKG